MSLSLPVHLSSSSTSREIYLPISHPSILMPPPSTIVMPYRKRDRESTGSSADESDGEEEYQPGPSTSKRSIKKPVPATVGGSKTTKMSREALRKANHSLIERRRREKINFALGELRGMVPGLGEEKGGKAGEFKLEVLERTVEHMKDLKAEIIELQSKVAVLESGKKRSAPHTADEHRNKRKATTISTTPPSPSLSPERRQAQIPESPDPNETESEAGLPPPLTVASRSSSHPSITSLLNSSNHQHAHGRRPPPPPEAANPTLYLPFPTPSPTSPFLTYAASNASTSTLGTMEPSPFIAPLQNFSLFGGAISLDTNSPEISMARHGNGNGNGNGQGPPEISMPPPKGKDEQRMPSPEEAANLLLAFSSPDVLRPVHGGTPVFAPANGRRGTLDADEFSLDGRGDHSRPSHGNGQSQWARGGLVGKTARDFLRM